MSARSIPDDEIIAFVSGSDDRSLLTVIEAARAELHSRAVAGGDTDAVIEEGFANGFSGRGEARPPWMQSGFVVCPGAKIGNSSGTRHTCTFVSVGDTWVWEAPETVCDVVQPDGASMRSVSLVAALEGLTLDMVASKYSNGSHSMQQARSYVVRGGELVEVGSRRKRIDGHR